MSGGKNCYPGSDVLINKYNIRDKELLEKFEIQKVFAKLLGLDVNPARIAYTYDAEHLINIHKYLFGDIYEWAGVFRDENLYKSERVLSGGAAEYADYHEIETRLSTLLSKYEKIDWTTIENVSEVVMGFLLSLWSIHPFREGNTRTYITFLWHYLKGKGIDFQVALQGNEHKTEYSMKEEQAGEQYKIAKADYEAFREKYSIKKNGN